jgi:hypothetical protein
MHPGAVDSTVNPCLEYVECLKIFEITQIGIGCAKEEDHLMKRDVERSRGERP